MEIPTSQVISLSLMTTGIVLICLGMTVLFLSLKYKKLVLLCDTDSSISVTSPILLRHEAENDQQLIVTWNEMENKKVTVAVMEHIEPRGGVTPLSFGRLTSASGHLAPNLSKGNYCVMFSSPDNSMRNVNFHIQPVEYRLQFKEYQPIALALLSIGTILLVNGLGIYLR